MIQEFPTRLISRSVLPAFTLTKLTSLQSKLRYSLRRRRPTGMSLSIVVLLLLVAVPPLSATSLPPRRDSHVITNVLPRNSDETPPPPTEYTEVGRPLRTDFLRPSCSLPILSHTFGETVGLPPINASYFPPCNCTWSRAVLHLSGASNGSQDSRISAVWLSRAEILRTSTPESSPDGVFWNVRKDVTKYSPLLRQSNLTLSIMLENAVDAVYPGAYSVNLTILFYDVDSYGTDYGGINYSSSLRLPNWNSKIRKLKLGAQQDVAASTYPMELDENPADVIIPISASGDEGFWFKIQSELDSVYQGIQFPANTYRAVIEVYVSSHDTDELWFSNPPDSYIETNHLPTKTGHGAFREVLVNVDNILVGSVVPFPVISPGGINPFFWNPVVAIGAFDFPSYEIELTPFLGILLDGREHYYSLRVADAISYWLLGANLHLWLDDKVDKVQAGPTEYINPSTLELERESEFQQLDGSFDIEGRRKTELTGWVNSSAGNLTTHLLQEMKFENTIEFKNNGAKKKVDHEVKMTSKLTVKSDSGQTIAQTEVERKYPLEMETTTLVGSGKNNYLIFTKLEHSLKEEKNGDYQSKLKNSQTSKGWMFVADNNVISGNASTHQQYEFKDKLDCYKHIVTAEGGSIKSNTSNSLCATAAF